MRHSALQVSRSQHLPGSHARETFRVLKGKGQATFGEYRTGPLLLAGCERQQKGNQE